MPAIMVEYPIFIRNDEIPTMLIENSSLHNKVCIEGHHFSGFKVIFVNSSAQKYVVADLDAEVLMNLLPKTPFHNVLTIKSIPLNPRGVPPKPPGSATITSM